MMKLKLNLIIIVILGTLLMLSCTSDSDSNENEVEIEPELIEHYFFEGKLDDETFNIEKKIYSNFFEDTSFLDYGGTLINCFNELEEDIHSNCYTIYSCGILANNTFFNSAKMYFGRIDVEKRIFENEIESLESFLGNDELSFRRDFGSSKVESGLAFDFFPIKTDPNIDFYFSTRFNDNSEYVAKITSVEKTDNYFYIVDGIIDECKLYDSRTYSSANPTYKLVTNFKFRVEIKGSFNYNNYKDD